MIEGVKIKQLRVVPDERGKLMEMLRADDEIFEKFGQVYVTTTYPQVIKAWHYHKKQNDNFAVVKGMIKLALFDARKDSKTYNQVQELFVGEYNPVLVHVPKGVYHGWKCIGQQEAIIINCPTEVYNYDDPDEFRLPYDTDEIPYNWDIKMG